MSINKDILKTLAYFDIFSYPLKEEEIFLFMSHTAAEVEFQEALKNLLSTSVIFKIGDFFSLQNDNSLSNRRKEGNNKARKLLKVARRVSFLISCFPYVKGVAISGSLSKEFADDKDDIDLFIVTSRNRLWITRSILFFWLRLARLFNIQKWFCMNYFVDEEMLEIPEKTIYSAIEIETLLPLEGYEIFSNFFVINNWTKKLLPNTRAKTNLNKKESKNLVKRILEGALNNIYGDQLDDLLMQATQKRLGKKTHILNKNPRGMLLVEKHVARHDPGAFQVDFMYKYENRVLEVFQKYDMTVGDLRLTTV